MKKIYLTIILLSSLLGIAQIPSGYYNTATGSGYILKTQLHNIIKNNTNSSSTANYGDLWTLYTQSAMRDNYDDQDLSLIDLYSENPGNTPDPYNYTSTSQQCGSSTPSSEGVCYNREHIIPQNVFGGSVYPMYSDAHFVLPSDNRVNGWRDSYPFGLVNPASIQCSNSSNDNVPCFTRNSSKIGPNTNSDYTLGYSGVVFEPIDAYKGDVARAVLYFVTRYQDRLTGWSYTMFNGTSDQGLTDTFLNIMIKWHLIDPPSQYEIDKNNAVYIHQGNRNPFIDNKDYVCQIWSTECARLSTDQFVFNDKITIAPNPSNGQFRIQVEESLGELDIEIYSLVGQKVYEKSNFSDTEIFINDLAKGVYLAKFSRNSQSIVKKIVIN